ncbi:MAG: CoA transferase [Dehalococcoidia bacterium]|nr:CoA transferase [Dehalococcoidia bacterium]
MPDPALSDLRVIEVAQGIAGPYCGKLLASYGADVIKVEPPGAGDLSRRFGPFPEDIPHLEKSGTFLHLNTSKRSVTLDITGETGRLAFRRLLQNADILIENCAPGQMAQWGLGYDDLKADLPRLIYVSISPFGQTGPYRDYKGNSLTAMATSGVMYVTGAPDREPLTTGGEPAEYLAGMYAWLGALAALAYRDRENAGQQVDVSLMEAAASADEYSAAMYAFMGAIRRRYYSRHLFSYPSDIYACKDGHVVVSPAAQGFPSPTATDQGASPMSLLLGDVELDQNDLFRDRWARWFRWQEFERLLQPYLESNSADEIVSFAQALRMPFAHVFNAAQLLENEHLRERGFFQEIDHPQAGRLKYTGDLFKADRMKAPLRRAPLLGEHNEEILGGELGYTKKDLEVLRGQGVI